MRLDDINEGLEDPKDNPCWKGYHPVGTKKKDGRTVPNCVPKESVEEGLTDEVNPADVGEYDREGDMAIGQLNTIEDAAAELRSILDAEDNLPEWVQSKITKAVDYIDTARDYMKSKDGVTEVSKSTLDRYVSKAVDAHGHADFAARQSKNDPTLRSYHVDQKKTAEKRRQGISRALDRMSKEGVAETNVSKYKDLGATNQTTHFIKNVTTGEIISPHRSLQDAEDALVAHYRGPRDGNEYKIVRARKEGVAEERTSALSRAVSEAGWGRRYSSYHDELSSRERAEQDYMDQSKRDFKRAEMQHELGHEDDPNFERNLRQQQIDRDRGPWYIRIDGKVYKQKGAAKSFDWKRGANNYALAMIKNNPSLQGRVLLTKSAEDK